MHPISQWLSSQHLFLRHPLLDQTCVHRRCQERGDKQSPVSLSKTIAEKAFYNSVESPDPKLASISFVSNNVADYLEQDPELLYLSSGKLSLSCRDKCEEMLNDWLKLLPPDMRWKDSDPPAEDINMARLRANFYGTKYIIHQLFLNYALHDMLHDMLHAHLEAQNWEILRSARHCLEAAMRNTEAFDGVAKNERLIVTNIFSTAHA